MPKQIVADVFETLGGVAKSTGQQAGMQAKRSAEDVAKSLGLKSDEELIKEQQGPPAAHNQEQFKKIDEASQKRTLARYQQIQAEIKQLEDKRKNQTPEQVKGKPGFDEERTIKQLETGEVSKKEEKLPPIPAQRASRKAEMFRGASG